MEKILGQHTLLELYQCDHLVLDDPVLLEKIMLEAAELAEVHILKSHFHQFVPQGVSGSIIIAESHFNIHTWPEHSYAAIDLFTCGSTLKIENAITHLIAKLKSKEQNIKTINRGLGLK